MKRLSLTGMKFTMKIQINILGIIYIWAALVYCWVIDSGPTVYLFKIPGHFHSFIYLGIFILALVYQPNYRLMRLILAYWVVDITIISILQTWDFRPIGELGQSGILIDVILHSLKDALFAIVLYSLGKLGIITLNRLSWGVMVYFCLNAAIHTIAAFRSYESITSKVAEYYDSSIYGLFYLLLVWLLFARGEGNVLFSYFNFYKLFYNRRMGVSKS